VTVFWLSVGFGFVTASVLALASVGLSLQFGVTNYVNFAYGAFLTLGAYFAWTVLTGGHLPLWLAILIGSLGVGVVGVVSDRVVFRSFTRSGFPLFYLLIVSFGLSLILGNVVQGVWGPSPQFFAVVSQYPLHIGPFLLTPAQLVIIGVAILTMVGVHLLLTRTRLGKAMRAMSDNPALAQVSGIDINRVTTWAWFISGTLAGLAGIGLAISTASFEPAFGENFLFIIFAAVIVGGIGQPYGAMLGAFVIGMVTEVSAAIIDPAYSTDLAFVVLIVMLLLRPQGLIPARGKA